MQSPLAKKIDGFMKKNNRVNNKSVLAVGLSGGADSVTLLLVLKELGFPLFALHIHHGIRTEADLDVQFCRELCEKLDVPLQVDYVDAPIYAKENHCSLEDAARQLRYTAFEKYRMKVNADFVAVAHHKDDQAETVLHHFLRGSGSQGLAGMKFINGKIIRPFLCVGREEIDKHLEIVGMNCIVDATNKDNYYTRNSIRNELLPRIKERYNPNIVENLNRMSMILCDENAFLEEEARKQFELITLKSTQGLYLDIEACAKLHIALIRRVFRFCLEEVLSDTKNLGFEHIERVIDLMKLSSGKQADIVRGVKAVREYNYLIFIKEDHINNEEAYSCSLDTRGDKGYIQEAGIYYALDVLPLDVVNQDMAAINVDRLKMNYKDSFKNEIKVYTKFFDYDKIKANLVLRTRRSGDRIRINTKGGSKSIKKFFIDEKVQASIRDRIPILVMEQQVIWIVGYRVDPYYEITQDTKMVLRVELTKEDNNGSNN